MNFLDLKVLKLYATFKNKVYAFIKMFSDWPSELVPQHGWGDEDSISAFKVKLYNSYKFLYGLGNM